MEGAGASEAVIRDHVRDAGTLLNRGAFDNSLGQTLRIQGSQADNQAVYEGFQFILVDRGSRWSQGDE
jgi:hypothetical protein